MVTVWRKEVLSVNGSSTVGLNASMSVDALLVLD
jgi:hypothetical protein